jgi:hypothetical protein
MAVFDHQAFAVKFVTAMNDQDQTAFNALVAPDFITEWPQTRERIRGIPNYWAVMNGAPSGMAGRGNELGTLTAQPTDAVRLAAPSFTFVTVEGAGNSGTITCKARFPDGADRWVVALYRLRDERLAKITVFFAAVSEPPQWRAHLVERIEQ